MARGLTDGRPGIESVGNRKDFPREQWGVKDFEDERKMLASQPRGDALPVYQPAILAPAGFTLFPDKKLPHDARSPGVSALLKQVGIR